MKNILVTGGSGFIGKNIVLGLQQEYTIFSPTHRELDLLDSNKVKTFVNNNSIDTVIHSATAVKENYFEQTIMMFRSILGIADSVERIIYFGTGAEYDKQRDLIKVNESAFGKKIPKDHNGLSKYINSLLAQNIPNITTLRLFGVYGPYEDYRKKFISNAIVKHLLGMPLEIKQNVLFDYLYIDDLVRVVRMFLKRPSNHGVFNVTPDDSILLSDLARMINTVGGKDMPITIANPGFNFQYTGNNRKFRRLFPSFRFHTYKQGVGKLYAFYRSRFHELDTKSIKEDTYLKNAVIRKQ